MVSIRICTRIDLQHTNRTQNLVTSSMRLRYTLSDRQIKCFANVPVLSLVVVHHSSDDAGVVGDESIERLDPLHSRYGDLINYVADGCAVSSLVLLCAGVALVGIVAIGVGG